MPPSPAAVDKHMPLREALSDIKGWRNFGFVPLDEEIVKALQLDDYAFQNYSNGRSTISLYIGYYLTMKKVGAVHDPLVCFPGGGWELSNRKKGILLISQETGESISYSAMIAQKGHQKELIIYWFQSYDETNPDTFSQKITSLYKKIVEKREDNAFVRISTPVGENPLPEDCETVFNFIRAFYPVFLEYVETG
jgi:EpsI family protein